MAEAEAYLTELAALLIAQGFTVDTAVVYDGAAAAILDEAEGREVDLIVMATHGRGGFGRLRYGSVAEAVLLVRAWGGNATAPFGVRPRLLVPLAGSAFAGEALPVAAKLALALGGEMILLHAVSPFEQVFMPEAILANFPEQAAAQGVEARECLEQLAARGATGGCQTTIDVRLDVPTLAIEEAARDHAADLVVMATRGWRSAALPTRCCNTAVCRSSWSVRVGGRPSGNTRRSHERRQSGQRQTTDLAYVGLAGITPYNSRSGLTEPALRALGDEGVLISA